MLNPHFDSARDARDLTLFSVLGVLILSIIGLAQSDWFYDLVMHPPRALPTVCILKKITGIPCPGCGLTRSFLAAARGAFEQSFAHHSLGIPLLVYGTARFARSGISLFCYRQTRLVTKMERIDSQLRVFGILLILLLFFNWLIDMAFF